MSKNKTWKVKGQKLIHKARQKHLNILIWGPGKPDGVVTEDKIKLFKKRVQIKEALHENFPNAEVYLSEDPEAQEIVRGVTDELKQEEIQAYTADIIFVLDISRGADFEVDYFVPSFAWFRTKAFVFIPERYIPARGMLKNVFNKLGAQQILKFTQAEFDICTLATETAVQVATTFAVSEVVRD